MRRQHVLSIGGLVAMMIVVAVGVAGLNAPPVRWGGVGALFYYTSLDQWRADVVAQGSSVAIARVTSVSDVQWSTASGAKPGQADVERVNRGEAIFGLGRLVSLELVRQIDGSWPTDAIAHYFMPGGQLGNDYTPPSELVHHLPVPKVGELTLATILPRPDDLDDSDGTLMVEIGALFPVSGDGFLMSPNHAEVVRINDIRSGK